MVPALKRLNKEQQLPEWAIHISEVYEWAAQPTIFGGALPKRTIRWYSSSGLLPLPEHYGKNAYYDKRNIFCYLRVIELLNKAFKLPLPAIKSIVDKIAHMPAINNSRGQHGSASAFPIVDVYDFLVDFIISDMDTYRLEARAVLDVLDRKKLLAVTLKSCDLKAAILTALSGDSSAISLMIAQGFKPFKKSVEDKIAKKEKQLRSLGKA